MFEYNIRTPRASRHFALVTQLAYLYPNDTDVLSSLQRQLKKDILDLILGLHTQHCTSFV